LAVIAENRRLGESVIGFVSVISGFLPAYYRFWDESAFRGALATAVFPRWMCWNVLRENFDVQITPNNTK
jgi:hypothetical protein